MSLFKSLSGIAKQATGSVSGFRKILDFNPSASSFLLPPQVQLGLKVANSLGLKVPSPDELLKLGTKEIDKILPGVRNTTDKVLKGLEQATKTVDSVEESLSKIDWLL